MVLLVDDHDDLRRVVALLIRAEGYEVVEAVSATEAMAVIAARRPHCVVLDGHMPDADGLTLLRALRADPALSAVRVLFFTADDALRAPAMAAGADAFIEKSSLDFGVLRRELERHCQAPARPTPVRAPPPASPRRIG